MSTTVCSSFGTFVATGLAIDSLDLQENLLTVKASSENLKRKSKLEIYYLSPMLNGSLMLTKIL